MHLACRRQHRDEDVPKKTVESFLEWILELYKLTDITNGVPLVTFDNQELHMSVDISPKILCGFVFLLVEINTSSKTQRQLLVVLDKFS